jgi:hypothetical protein
MFLKMLKVLESNKRLKIYDLMKSIFIVQKIFEITIIYLYLNYF